jgi:hypothetical protein
MSGLGKQLRGSGIAKIQHQRTPFEHGGKVLKEVDLEKNPGLAKLPTEVRNKMGYMKKGGRAGYVQGGGANVGDVKIKIPPYLKKGMVKLGLKKGGSANWIQGAIKKPGALRKSLGVKAGEKIPASKLAAAAKKPGKLGRRARFAETLRGLKK